MKATFAYLHFKTLDSTHLWCKRELSTVSAFLKQADCLLISCDEQTAGIGRSGKSWKAAKEHLSMQLCFSARNLLPASLSLAISNALSLFLQTKGVPAKLKWPNDIWTARGKIAGLILENVSYEKETFCLIGIGLNISDPSQNSDTLEAGNNPIIDQPVDFVRRYLVDSPSIEMLAIEIAREVLKAVESQEMNPMAVETFMRNSWTCPGAFIEASLEEGRLEGTILRFEDQGDLILKTARGEEKRLRSGLCQRIRVLKNIQGPAFQAPASPFTSIQTTTCTSSKMLRKS